MTESNDATDDGFDPADHTAKEVIAHIEKNPDEAEAIAEAEAEGKGRSTVVAAAEEAAEKPARRRAPKREARTGTYVLEPGDSPAVVARNLLGRGSLAREVVAANPDVKWRPGVEINLPTVD